MWQPIDIILAWFVMLALLGSAGFFICVSLDIFGSDRHEPLSKSKKEFMPRFKIEAQPEKPIKPVYYYDNEVKYRGIDLETGVTCFLNENN